MSKFPKPILGKVKRSSPISCWIKSTARERTRVNGEYSHVQCKMSQPKMKKIWIVSKVIAHGSEMMQKSMKTLIFVNFGTCTDI